MLPPKGEEWTYEGYWKAVIGDLTPLDVVQDIEMVGAKSTLDTWLCEAETRLAQQVGGDNLPTLWSAHHKRALSDLCDAVDQVYGTDRTTAIDRSEIFRRK